MKIKMPRNNSILILNINGREPAAIRINDVAKYTTGFGFWVASELEAMQAAYYYRHAHDVELNFLSTSTNSTEWYVNVAVLPENRDW